MKTMHLFAGIGGGLLADVILGHTPVVAVEINPYCCQVLRERCDDGWFPGMYIHEGDVRSFDYYSWKGRVDQISAGFPCQDISAAGRGMGITGERSGLVSEVWRAIDAIHPRFVFLENSPRINTRGRDVVWKELEGRGYTVKDGTLAASDVGSLHIRNRWWLLASDADSLQLWEQSRRWSRTEGEVEAKPSETSPDSDSPRQLQRGRIISEKWGRISDETRKTPDTLQQGLQKFWREDAHRTRKVAPSDDVAPSPDTLRDRLQISIQQGWLSETDGEAIQAASGYCGEFGWNPTNSDICGMVHGFSPKVESIKGLGNAQVPLQAALAWVLLYQKLIDSK